VELTNNPYKGQSVQKPCPPGLQPITPQKRGREKKGPEPHLQRGNPTKEKGLSRQTGAIKREESYP